MGLHLHLHVFEKQQTQTHTRMHARTHTHAHTHLLPTERKTSAQSMGYKSFLCTAKASHWYSTSSVIVAVGIFSESRAAPAALRAKIRLFDPFVLSSQTRTTLSSQASSVPHKLLHVRSMLIDFLANTCKRSWPSLKRDSSLGSVDDSCRSIATEKENKIYKKRMKYFLSEVLCYAVSDVFETKWTASWE